MATKAAKKKPSAIAVDGTTVQSEAAEADWWYENRALAEDLLARHGRRVGNDLEVEVELKA